MSIRHSLLALLQDRPRYGYQLRTEFEDRTGSSWPLNIGQVYTTLDRLERDGLVRNDGGDGEGHVMYSITAAGRTEVSGWFAPRWHAANPPRNELAIKLALGLTLPGVDVGSHHPGPARRFHPGPAGLYQGPARHRRPPAPGRHGPAAGAGFADLPDRGRDPLAGPVRGPAGAACTGFRHAQPGT